MENTAKVHAMICRKYSHMSLLNTKTRNISSNQLYFLWFCFWATTAIGQANNQFDQQIVFTTLGIKDGLSQSSVFDIQQDTVGYLWFATEDGLNKFDGYRFTVYQNDMDRPNSLLDNWVKAVLVDREGTLWIGTRTGLNRYNAASDDFTHFLHSEEHLSNNIREGISRIVQGPNGFLWIGSFAGGLTRFNPATGESVAFAEIAPQELTDLRVRSVMFSRDGFLWVGTKNGLHEIDPETLRYRTHLNQATETTISHPEVRSICEDDLGFIWIGTTRGLNRLDRSSRRIRQWLRDPERTDALADDWVNAVFQDPIRQTIWVGTRNGGLACYDRETDSFQSYRANSIIGTSITSDNVLCTFLDRSGVFWIGSYLAGLSKFSIYSKPFMLVRGYMGAEKSLSDNNVRALFRDSQKRTWVGTIDGLNVLDKNMSVLHTYLHDPDKPGGLSEYQVLSLREDSENRIWVGTYGAGLNIIDPETHKFDYFASDRTDGKTICDDYIHDILRDRTGVMWIGTRDGLQYYVKEENRFVTAPLPGTHDSILKIIEDSKGVLWIGMYGSGLVKFDPTTRITTRYMHQSSRRDSLSSDYVTSILEADDGQYWVGTFSGLNLMMPDQSTFRVFDTKSGLPNAVIHAITHGSGGDIWFSTNRGLVRLRKEQGDYTFRNYDEADGLQGNEFLSGSAHQGDDGLLMFGGANGFNVFFPDQIQESPYIPPIAITSFRVFDEKRVINRQADGFDTVILSHSDKFISFEFAALDYTYPAKNLYRFKLEGFDSDWTSNDRRYISYSNLAGGNYVFRVQGSNHDGVWNHAGIALPITVIPPFWERIWFIALAILLFAAIIYWRFWDLSRQNTSLESHVASRTFDLKTANEDLVAAQQQLVDTAHRAGMAEMAVDILHNIGNALNSVYISAEMIQNHLSTDRLGSLCKRLSDRIRKQEKESDHIADSLLRIADASDNERKLLHNESMQIQIRVNHIKEIISAQQDYALMGPLFDQLSLRVLVADAITIMSQTIQKWNIKTEIEVGDEWMIYAQKSRLLQVIINIIKNACEAMAEKPLSEDRLLRIAASNVDQVVHLQFRDSGHGIDEADLQRVFSHGYTNKEHGHGFGLHFCANAMTEMGGKVSVTSAGPGLGAVFILEIPLFAESRKTKTG